MPEYKHPDNWPHVWMRFMNFTDTLQTPEFIPAKSLLDDFPCCSHPKHEALILPIMDYKGAELGFDTEFNIYVLCRSCKAGYYLKAPSGLYLKTKPEILRDVLIATITVCRMFCHVYGGYTPLTLENLS